MFNRILRILVFLPFVTVWVVSARAQSVPFVDIPYDASPDAEVYGPGGLLFHEAPTAKGGLTDAQIQFYREQLAQLLGIEDLFAVPIDERPPLNPVIKSQIDAGTYTIYKLYYESLPKNYVSANLYVPTSASFPLPRPAVVMPHGHWAPLEAKAARETQIPAIGLVLQGYVVLAWDVVGLGERKRGGTLYEGDESLSAAQAYVGGPLVMGMEAYEVSRAIDYLNTRPDVADMNHFAVTGASGGASQTIYATALDPRIQVAVPVAFSGIGRTHQFGTGCESLPLFVDYLDERPNLLALVYPAKVSFLTETTDGAIPLAQETYADRDHSSWIHYEVVDTPHGYGEPFRERMYAWLSRYVLGVEVGDTQPDPTGVSDTMTVRTAAQLNVGLPSDRLTFLSVAAGLRSGLPGLERPASPAAWTAQAQSVRTAVSTLLKWSPSTGPSDVLPGSPGDNPESIAILPEDLTVVLSYGSEVFTFDGWLDATLYKPLTPGPWPCIVLLNPPEYCNSWDTACAAVAVPIDDAPIVNALLAAGYAVLKIPPRYGDLPSTDPVLTQQDFETGLARALNYWGPPLFGRRAWDVSAARAYLATRGDILGWHVSVWGMGEGAKLAAAAGALDDELCEVIADRSAVSFSVTQNDRHPAWSYPPKILLYADVPELAETIVPRRLILANPVTDARAPLDLAEVEAAMDWTSAGYQALDAADQFQPLVGVAVNDVVAALDISCGPEVATAIDLVSFTATGAISRVDLEWATATESDNAGFHVWRADFETGVYARITSVLIPSTGSPAEGASYAYSDSAVKGGRTYWYKLEAVDLHGRSTFHGPASARALTAPFGCGMTDGARGGGDLALPLLLAALAAFLPRRRER